MGKAGKILIVDDDDLILEVVSDILVHDDYEVFVAHNGLDALDNVREHVPDVIILDVMMPVLDGIETCKRLKGNRATAAIPILMLTARTSISDKFDGFDAGADEYISKPFDPKLLRERVASLFRRANK